MTRILLLALSTVAAAHAQTVIVQPYVQPGDGAALSGGDVKVITWLTDQKPGDFTVEYTLKGGAPKTVKPAMHPLDFAKPKSKPKIPAPTPGSEKKDEPKEEKKGDEKKDPKAPKESDAALTLDDLKEKTAEKFGSIPEREHHYFRYRAELPGLPFDSEVTWRVRLGKTLVREATVKTRATAAKPIRFIAIGDMASNKPEQYAVAYQMSLAKPDFMVALGDIVYPGGRVLQYLNHFFPCYNDVKTPGPKDGAPLIASVPLYPVVGNHDADNQRFPDFPDAYSCFYWFSVPKNGPGDGPWNLPLGKDAALATAFKSAAGPEFPAMSNYSFDYGPAHFLVLDANTYATKENTKIFPWIEKDLSESKQPWKFVCFHHPAFHTSREHYTTQKMRLLQPIFERTGVDVVFAGHVHNYQRSKPLKFVPSVEKPDKLGRVDGTFTLDATFDGVKDTTPEGVVHIVSGGGGAKLYSVDLAKTVEYLRKFHPDNYTPITDKYVGAHCFSVVELTAKTFELRQIDLNGKEVDRFKITK